MNDELTYPLCSIIIVAYNNAVDLPACLDSLLAQDYPAFEVIVVDNASTDATEAVIVRYGDRVHYLRLPQNVGFAAGNNHGAARATGSILVFLNPDTTPQPGWLSALVGQLVADQSVGLTTSRILLAEDPQLVNTCGNTITWTGLTVCRGLGEKADQWQDASEVAAVSGAAFAIWRDLFQTLGGFDEAFFLYYEDTDLSLRAQLAGYRVWYSPDSIVTHKYVFKFSPQKAYYQERNRWLTLLKVFRLPTIALLLPGLMLGELMAWVYAGLHGPAHLAAKRAGWGWLWQNRRQVWRMRQATQARRYVRDRDLLRLWSPRLSFAGAAPPPLARALESVVQPVLAGYGRLCSQVIVW